MKQPMQPLVLAGERIAFQPNAIVSFMLDWCRSRGLDMNDLARMNFSDEDRQQFAQLIGYSLSGYSELPYVDSKAWSRANSTERRNRIKPC